MRPCRFPACALTVLKRAAADVLSPEREEEHCARHESRSTQARLRLDGVAWGMVGHLGRRTSVVRRHH